MTDHERGAYTPPTDGPLAFEARQPVRGAKPFPLTLVVSVLVLVGLAAAIFVFYRSGVRQGAATPQAVGQPVGPLKEAAPPDAQPQDPAAGLQIYRSEAGQPPQPVQAQPSFVPPAEQPELRAATRSVPPPAAAPTTPITSAPAPALRPAQPLPDTTPGPAATPAPKAQVAEAKPAPKVAAPAEKAAMEKPAAKSVAAKTPQKPAAKTAEGPAAKSAGAAAVQVGAVGSPQLADRTWNEAVAAAPGMAAGKGKGVEKVEKDGKTLYRTSVTGFASRAEAQAFCAKLKAAGKACFVK